MSRREIVGTEHGFTLVEIAIAVAIAGIVAMLAVPSILGVFPRMRLANETITLANEVALARARAISKNHYPRVIFDDAADSYTLQNTTLGDTIARNTLTTGIDMYNVENLNAADTIAIRPVGSIGRLDGGGNYEELPIGVVARIHLQTEDTAYRKRVVVAGTGRIFVERWTGGIDWVEE